MERVNIMSGLTDEASLMHRYTYAMTQTDTQILMAVVVLVGAECGVNG